MNPKQAKYKEIHTQTHYNQLSKDKENIFFKKILITTREKTIHYIPKKLLIDFSSEIMSTKSSDVQSVQHSVYSQSAKRKKTINQEFYIQQNYPSKNEGKIKTFPNKYRLKKVLPAELPYKKY